MIEDVGSSPPVIYIRRCNKVSIGIQKWSAPEGRTGLMKDPSRISARRAAAPFHFSRVKVEALRHGESFCFS